MRRPYLWIAALALLLPAAARAQTLTPVNPFPGSIKTSVFGINDSGVIVGSYVDQSDVEHGFFGPLNGAYTSFDVPGALATEARSIDPDGNIVGIVPPSPGSPGEEFFRAPNGAFTIIKKGGMPLSGTAQGIAAKRHSVGDYTIPASGAVMGYLAVAGRYKSDVTLNVDTTAVSPRGINRYGAVAGFFIDSKGHSHGFIQDALGTKVIDADGNGTTTLQGMNPYTQNECTIGQFGSHSGQSFIYNAKTNGFTAIVVPGAKTQQAWGMNRLFQVAVDTNIGPFIFDPSKNAPVKHGCPTGGIGNSFRDASVRMLR
jgi:hypothetical protein